MRTSTSNLGSRWKISLAICSPSNSRSWRDEHSSRTGQNTTVEVHIALRMRRRLQDHVATMRRILLRERELVPLHRIQETDSTCLRWYARQPGNTTPEKAGPK